MPHFFKQAYQDEKGVPCEEPYLDGKVVQEVPGQTRRISLPVVTGQ